MKRKTSTPGFRIEYSLGGNPQQQAWTPEAGAPTAANLERWRQQMNSSLKLGGNNYHLSKAAGVILHCGDVRLIRQRNNDVVATASQPIFEII